MDSATRAIYTNLQAADGDVRYAAYNEILKITEQYVDWAYEVWDDLLVQLRHKDNHLRSIAAQLLSNLAKSDPEHRMLRDFDALLAVTKDEKFVTARHSLQSLWKVGAAGAHQQQMVLAALAGRFSECRAEKNCTLIRYDIIQGLQQLYTKVQDEQIKTKALALIETEPDAKYRKKYTSVWKNKHSS